MIYKKIFTLIFISIFLISMASALTFKQSTEVGVKIVCINNGYCSSSAVCNASIFDPDNLVIKDGVQATQSSTLAQYNITLNSTQTSKLGTYQVKGFCKDGSVAKEIDFTFDVTLSGNPTPSGLPTFQMGLIVIIFCVSCFLLYLSSVMNEVAFKIFFLLTSLIFLMATMITTYMVSTDINISATINAATLALVTVLGVILFIIFIYILIRQTINALDLLRIKRGLAWNVGAGSKVGGYNTKKAY